MSGMCSTGHPWLDGAPSCGCDVPSTEVPGYVRLTVEPLPAAAARTVITPDPATSARVSATRVVAQVVEAPILSEDGWWQWDGESWIPADTPPTAEPAHAAAPAYIAPAYTEPTVTAVPAQTATPEWATWSAPATAPPVAATPAAPLAATPTSAYAPPAATPPLVPGYVGPPIGLGSDVGAGSDGFAIASLVLGILWLGGLGSTLAIIFAAVSQRSARRNGRSTPGKAIAGAVLGVVGLLLTTLALASHAVTLTTYQPANARVISPSDATVRDTLRSAANVEETYYAANGTYAHAAELLDAGLMVPSGVQVVVDADGAAGYCLAGGLVDGSRWYDYDSTHGGLQASTYPTPSAALSACVQAARGADGASSATPAGPSA